jgi:hypothetical protein
VSTSRSALYAVVSLKHPGDLWQRIFDGIHITTALQFEVDVLEARPCALSRCTDSPDVLAALDAITDPGGSLGKSQ